MNEETKDLNLIPLHHIFPGVNVRRIDYGAELQLCLALHMYLKAANPKNRLDLSYVKIDPQLMTQPLYAMMRNEQSCPDGVIFSQSSAAVVEYNVSAGIVPDILYDHVILERDEANNYVFRLVKLDDAVVTSTNACVKAGAPYSYVCLFARVMVDNYLNKTSYKLIVRQDGASIEEDEYSALISLRKYGNKFGEKYMELDYIDTNTAADDREWNAYCWEHRQHGLMASYKSNVYSASEKLGWFQKNNNRVGDVVLLIKRKPSKTETAVNKNRQNCYLAVITGLDTKGVTLQYVPRAETQLTQRKYIEDTIRRHGHSIYSEADKYKFVPCNVNFPWGQIGVDGYSSKEYWLILPLLNEDCMPQWLTDGQKDYLVNLDTLDTVYAVLEDRGIKYEKGRFLNRYFKNRTPVYDDYRARREAYEASQKAAEQQG